MLRLRSTAFLVALVALASCLTYVNLTFSPTGDAVSRPVLPAVAAPGALFLSILCGLGAMPFGSEYRQNSLRFTLSLVPSRTLFFLGKMAAVEVASAALACLALVLSCIAASIYALTHPLVALAMPSTADAARTLLLYLGASACATAIACALSVITRSQLFAVVFPVVLGTLVEPALAIVGSGSVLPKLLPFAAARAAMDPQYGAILEGSWGNPWAAFGVCALYGVCLSMVAFALFRRCSA